MFLKKYKLYPVILFSLFSFPQLMHAQTDSLFLTVDQLFERAYNIACNFRRMQ